MKHPFCSAVAPGFVLLTMGLPAGAGASASSQPDSSAGALRKLPVPERGFISSTPAETWEQGLLSGNGTIGASVLSRPIDEIIVFSHKRMLVPDRKSVV